MANPRICSISECGKPSHARGMCNIHYCRWRRHGDPNGMNALAGAAEMFLREKALTYNGDDCLIWPFTRNGQGRAVLGNPNGTNLVHRRICIEVNGEPATPDMQATHSCGRGHDGCVNRRHLVWI